MDANNSPAGAGAPRQPEADGIVKKPYAKPAFRHERVFETRALSCGKMQSTQSGCGFHRRTS